MGFWNNPAVTIPALHDEDGGRRIPTPANLATTIFRNWIETVME
jgi:hypothetical protein